MGLQQKWRLVWPWSWVWHCDGEFEEFFSVDANEDR
jgi:hypothetical protein